MASFAARTAWPRSENALSRAVAELRAGGADLLDLTASNPTQANLPYDAEAILSALDDGSLLRYEPDPRGSADARAAVADYYRRRGLIVDPSALFLTASTSEAYSFLFRLLLDPGDQVLVPEPSYPLFDYLLDLADADRRRYRWAWDGAWYLDRDSLERGLEGGAKLILLVSPNNPTGTVLSPSDRAFVLGRARHYGATIVSDEVFADYSADHRAASLIGSEEVLGFSLSGLSKVAGLPQLKLGWMVPFGPSPEVAEASARLEIIADTYLSLSRPAEVAAPRLLTLAEPWQASLRARLEENRAELERQCLGTGLRARPSDGGWSAIIDRPRHQGDEAFVLELLREDQVLVHPGYFFDLAEDGCLVVSLILDPPQFREGIRRLVARAR